MSPFRTLFAAISGLAVSLGGCGQRTVQVPELPELDTKTDRELFFPVLRNYSQDDIFSQTIVHRQITDNLGVFACRRIDRPNGAVGVDYVLKRNLDLYDLTESEVLELCFTNLLDSGIQVNVREQDDSTLFELAGGKGLAAAIIAHESTYEKFGDIVGASELTVLVMNPDVVCITARGSDFESRFPNLVQELLKQSEAIDLTPRILRWNADGSLVEVSPY
jgi:hypothetical protein